MSRQGILVVNTRSRIGKTAFKQASATLDALGVDLEQRVATRSPGEIQHEVAKAVERKAPLIVVGGGDGTLSGVVSSFVGSASVLGVLPLGTGNQFARDLQIGCDVDSACDVIANGKEMRVDLGTVNDRYFINVVTVGLTTLIADELTPEGKRHFGRAIYVVALLRALAKVRAFQATIEIQGENHSYDTMQVVIGNGRLHAGPFPLSPDATITDGKLVVYAVTGTSRWNLLRYALHLPGGRHVQLAEVPTFQATCGSLKSLPVQRVTVDGEISLMTPLRFGVAPLALRVMCPDNFAAERAKI